MASLRNLTMSDSLAMSFPHVRDEYSDYCFKVVLIGDVSVGKTCALKRFRYGTYSEKHANTIGVDFTLKTLEVDGKVVQLHIWDTAGQERYRTITQSYYRNSHGVILAFDLTRERTFTNVSRWMDDIRQYCGEVPVLLVGTKLDLVTHNPHIREVETSSGEGMKRTRTNIIEYAEVSAKEGTNIDAAITKLGQELKKRVDILKGCGSYDHNLSNVYPKHIDTVQVDKESQHNGCCS